MWDTWARLCVSVCACVCVRVRACVHSCACMHACMAFDPDDTATPTGHGGGSPPGVSARADADARSKTKTATKEGDKVLWNPTQAKFELMELSQRKEKLHARLQVCVVLRELLHKDSFFFSMQADMHADIQKIESHTHT